MGFYFKHAQGNARQFSLTDRFLPGAHARMRRFRIVTGSHLKIPNGDFRASFHAVQTPILLVFFSKLGGSVRWGCK